MHCRTDDGKAFRTLNIVDEYSRECLAIRVDRKLNSGNVIDALSDLFILRGVPSFIRSDNGPEFVAQAVQDWIKAVGAKTAYIEPGSPWENGYCESFNARFRDEFLNGEIFYSLREAKILIEEWRKHYNTKRPHSALGYRPPAPRNHRTDGPKADHALTIKLDHSGGADQDPTARNGHAIELVGELAGILRLGGLDATKPPRFARAVPETMVAGVGFEPTTFRL